MAASIQWPERGVPQNPRAWLIQVASRRMSDHIRSEAARRRRESQVAKLEPFDRHVDYIADIDEEIGEDDTLILLFMCCHPSLTRPSAIALTLRAVGGLSTAEIGESLLDA